MTTSVEDIAVLTSATLGQQVLNFAENTLRLALNFPLRGAKNLQEPLNCLREISLEELSVHDSEHDCWVAIYDKVYDITDFIAEHPGGEELLLEYAGLDATLAFRSVGHTESAELLLSAYIVGVLPASQRAYPQKWQLHQC